MRLRALVLVLAITGGAAAQTPACKPLEDDRILGKDLAAVIPAFRPMPPETLLANTPPPGSQHIFHTPELLSLAQRYGLHIAGDATACFARAMEPLDRDRVLSAMRTALHIPDARIELAETSLYPVPKGRVEFDLDHLGTPATQDERSPVLWRGDLLYGDGHHFAIWARVRIMANCPEIVAAENLKPGRAIESSQLHVRMAEGFPMPVKQRLSIDAVVGMAPARPIAAGTVLRADLLTPPNVISRGEMIEIEVRSGAARLVLTARAESAGRDGDIIAVRNLESNKVFTAQVAGKGKAVIVTDFVRAE